MAIHFSAFTFTAPSKRRRRQKDDNDCCRLEYKVLSPPPPPLSSRNHRHQCNHRHHLNKHRHTCTQDTSSPSSPPAAHQLRQRGGKGRENNVAIYDLLVSHKCEEPALLTLLHCFFVTCTRGSTAVKQQKQKKAKAEASHCQEIYDQCP